MAGLNVAPPNNEVTVDQMDYAYIEKCSNEKELVRILRALRSGREGFYPDLIKFCEDKIRKMNPEHRALRKEQPILKAWDLDKDNLKNLNNDLESWTSEMKKMGEGVTDKKMFESNLQRDQVNGFSDHGDLPPVRGTQVLKGTAKKSNKGKEPNPDRIKSSDYRSWEKFNVDEECNKIDKEESTPASGPKAVNIPRNIDVTNLSEKEKMLKSVREKEKGNEAFKSGDYEEALSYYCRSITLLPIAASYNNRALVYLRLERWEDAIKDCNTVLQFEGEQNNLKAMLRRATAHKSMKRYAEAAADVEFVLSKEPNNARAKGILEDVAKLREKENVSRDKDRPEAKKGKKMVITEVDSSDEDTEPEIKPVKTHAEKSEVVMKAKETNESKPKAEEVSSISTASPEFPVKTAELKTKAGELFKSGRYGDAGEHYTKAIVSMSSYVKPGGTDPGHTAALAVLHNNRAACRLKQGDDRACVADCNEVLKVKKWDAKALMRRAMAYENMEKYAKAWADYQTAYSMDRGNVLAQNGANRVGQHLRDIHGSRWREKVPKIETPPMPALGDMHKNAIPDNKEAPKPVNISDVRKDGESTVAPAENLRAPSGIIKEGKKQKTKVDTVAPAEKLSVPSELPKNGKNQKTNSDDVNAVAPTENPGTPSEFSKEGKKQKSKKRNRPKSPRKVEVPSPTKEEAAIESKKTKIRQDLFQKLKADGNENVKQGKYDDAIDCYTRCLTLCPKEPASYTNRALCFLKLKKHVSAVNDCTEAIKLDPVNTKAYYRRALARKAEGYHGDARRDITKLLEIDPGNKAGRAELEDLKKLMGNTKKEVKPVHKKRMVIEEVDSSESSDEGEFVLPAEDSPERTEEVKIKVIGNENKTLNATAPLRKTGDNKSPKSADNESTKSAKITDNKLSKATDNKSAKSAKVTDNELAKAADNKSARSAEVTDKLSAKSVETTDSESTKSVRARLSADRQLTPYEFGHLWSAIASKKNHDEYKALLGRIRPEQLPALLSNKIDDHVIRMVSQVAREHATKSGDCRYAYDLLRCLTKADRFGVVAMFLSDSDKRILKDTFDAIRGDNSCVVTQDDISELEKKYA